MNFKEELKRRRQRADEAIAVYLPQEEGMASALAEAMNYNMKAPGKRLRPILIEAACGMYGGDKQEARPFMAAMEMVHTHSLIHDDLPALDNDDYRRGRQTTHVRYGEAAAVLAGDALLNYAYETALQALKDERDLLQKARALAILAQKSGLYGMLGGQSVDVASEGKTVSLELLRYIYEHKTAALLEGALMIGAVLAGASEVQVAQMEQIGHYLGLAFQIQDDILDVTGDPLEVGKPMHSDEKNEKTTWVTLIGLEAAQKEVARLSARAQECIVEQNEDAGFLRELIEFLITRTS